VQTVAAINSSSPVRKNSSLRQPLRAFPARKQTEEELRPVYSLRLLIPTHDSAEERFNRKENQMAASSLINDANLDCFDMTIPTEQKAFKPNGFYIAAQQYYREEGRTGGVPASVRRFDKIHWTVSFFFSSLVSCEFTLSKHRSELCGCFSAPTVSLNHCDMIVVLTFFPLFLAHARGREGLLEGQVRGIQTTSGVPPHAAVGRGDKVLRRQRPGIPPVPSRAVDSPEQDPPRHRSGREGWNVDLEGVRERCCVVNMFCECQF